MTPLVHYIPHALVGALLSIIGWLGKRVFESLKQEWDDAKATLKELSQTTHAAVDNHFVHIQDELKSLAEKQDIAHEQGEKQLEALQDISKGIAILVDHSG